MYKSDIGTAFIKRICDQSIHSAAVNHPYLTALSTGELPNIELAFKDFAFQYGLYTTNFTRYVSALIKNLSLEKHKNILLENLAEEQGDTHNFDLPSDVLSSIEGIPHTQLFRRFQEAVGVDEAYKKNAEKCQTGHLWSQQFLYLCQMNEYVGVGAIGIGTELIVSSIYRQILKGLEDHSQLNMLEHVFFDLHSECDDEHAAQINLIASELAQSHAACEQIEFGVKMGINLRVMFWDKMLERAQHFPSSNSLTHEKLSTIGY